MTLTETAFVQRALGLRVDGVPSAELVYEIRGFQRAHGLVVTGLVDDLTLRRLRATITDDLTPTWFGTDGQDAAVTERLGSCDEDTIRRLQSAAGLAITGAVDEPTARIIGD
jgi:peptidoglycan hydrolase-like protein with peptidoglycan-binding domain